MFLPLPQIIYKVFFLFAAIFLININLKSQFIQKVFKIDTTSKDYYETFDTLSNNRFFLSEKISSPQLFNSSHQTKVDYRSNGNLNLGVGHTFRYLTLNIGINFSFMNQDNQYKGRTRYLDLHSQIVGRPYIIDFFGQFYYGAYIVPESGPLPKGETYVQRPDINTQLIGLTSYFVPNWRRYSYAAAITQRDWQKKSAGSPLYGLEFFNGKIKGDSSLIPYDYKEFFEQPEVFKVKFTELGAGLGYGYTLVIKKNWFVHASAISAVSFGYSREYVGEATNGYLYLRPNFLIRPSMGYNSNRFSCSVYWFANRVIAGSSNMSYRINTANLRMTVAYRLKPKPWINKFYNQVF